MKFYKLGKYLAILCTLFVSATSTAFNVENKLLSQFSGYTENSTKSMDFSAVNEMLHAGVLNMGPSSRERIKPFVARTGTRLKQTVDTYTDGEANRFYYESLKDEQDQLLLLKQYLEYIPTETPLDLYSREEQLAYWLNLYNVSVIYEIAKIYPKSNLKKLLTDEDGLLSKKLVNVDGIKLSLNDIQYNILLNQYNKNPLINYGLYQGNIGGPNIRPLAYTGDNVFSSLKSNATDFINSNRGTQFNGEEMSVRVSTFYEKNSKFFPDFNIDLKQHLLKFANKEITEEIMQAKRFVPNIHNWRVADLYGSIRHYEGSVGTSRELERGKFSHQALMRLGNLMQIRARNFNSGGTVTVTDLEDAPEPEIESR